jgi:aryl-alcohol dehydrogenase-like predicted oxidoreductase
VIGRWLAEGGRRDQVIIETKGAHPYDGRSRMTAADIEADLLGSLERLGLDSVDLYVLHRDDPGVPVGAILDWLNGHLEAGRFGAIGASNWSTDRLDEADAHARSHGLRGFVCSSPNLSLARWSQPPWAGCASASERATRDWYAARRLPLLAWSPQAAGFFAVRDPDSLETDDRRVIAVYDSADNRERRRRAALLGATRGFDAGQVALGWVLNQPFPTVAIAGGRTPAELRSNARAVELSLTAEEIAWLDLEEVATPRAVARD